MSNSKSIKEIYRIREIMLYEQFGGNENMIPKYVEQVINKIGGEIPFERFFNGEATLREFRDNLTKKISEGDYGKDFAEVNNNLQYLKRLNAILGTLERQYEKDPEKFDGLDKFLFGEEGSSENPLEGLNEKVLYGDFCSDCKSNLDVSDKLNGVIEARKKIDQIETEKAEEIEKIKRRTTDPKEAERMLDKLYGDTAGVISFFTKGHVRRSQNILDKYNLRDSSITRKGANTVVIEVLNDVETLINNENRTILRRDRTYPTEYNSDEAYLVQSNKDYKIYIKINSEPKMGGEYVGLIEKVVPNPNTSEIEIEPKGLKVRFEVVEGGKPGRPKKSD